VVTVVHEQRPVNPDDRAPEPSRAKVSPFTRPDLVDRIFDYIIEQIPEIAERHPDFKRAVRNEFAMQLGYVRRRSIEEVQALAPEVARLFNGRSATEVARILNISRATVYRLLKQPGHR